MSVLNLHSRMHTIPDVDQGRIPNNPGVLGHYTPPDQTASRPWYFGGANQRTYVTREEREYLGDKGSFMTYGRQRPNRRLFEYGVEGRGNKGDWAYNTKHNPFSPKGSGARKPVKGFKGNPVKDIRKGLGGGASMFTKKGIRHNKEQLFGSGPMV